VPPLLVDRVTKMLSQLLISGFLMGLIFSLVAVGLTLIWGVVEIVNFAHGAFLMLGMYATYWLYRLLSIDPLFALPICTILLFFVGIVTYRLMIRRVLTAPMVAQIFSTFGLMVFLENMAHFLWSSDYRLIKEPLVHGRLEVFGLFISKPQLVAAAGAMVATGLVYWFVTRTQTGRALQATAEDKEAAALMGINSDRMFALAWGIGGACAGAAGVLLANFYFIFPKVGDIFNLTAFVVVALGGFGSIPGAFIAGIIIGLVQVLGGHLVAPAFKSVIVFIIYLVVVIARPQGLFGKF